MLTFTPNHQHYLEDQMKKVSRSFALVVSFLEPSLREQFSTAYLICRVVDNIEDCTEPFEWQQQRFMEFITLLKDPATAADVLSEWSKYSWPGLSGLERKLMTHNDGQMLWSIYEQLPDKSQDIIRRWAVAMAEGMHDIEDPVRSPMLLKRNGVKILETAEDYNRYCYYVAGTVGHMATELAAAHFGFSPATTAALKETCEACGRGLQKTNIIKDFVKDVERGISYVPNEWLRLARYSPLTLAGADHSFKERVLGDVFKELRDATRYVLALPDWASGYRIASLLCLFPAYQTLLNGARRQTRLFTKRHRIKISRGTMLNCIRDARQLVNDNAGIMAYSRASEDQFEAIFEAASV